MYSLDHAWCTEGALKVRMRSVPAFSDAHFRINTRLHDEEANKPWGNVSHQRKQDVVAWHSFQGGNVALVALCASGCEGCAQEGRGVESCCSCCDENCEHAG